MSLSCITIGLHHLYDCPGQNKIPVYLITIGVFMLATMVSWFGAEFFGDYFLCCNNLLLLFLLVDVIWLTCVTMWTVSYMDKLSFTNPASASYCSKTVYFAFLFAFGAPSALIFLMSLYICYLYCH